MYDILLVDEDTAGPAVVSSYQLWKESVFRIAAKATNGREALRLMERQRFDLIILDIRVSVIGGAELIRILKKNRSEICLIVTSRFHDYTCAKEAVRLGAIDYIEKPLSESKLIEALDLAEKYLSSRSQQNRNVLDLNAYITLPAKQQLYSMCKNSEDRLKERMAEIYDELLKRFNHREHRAAGVIDLLVKTLWEELEKEFNWLSILEQPPCKVVCRDDLPEAIQRLLEVSRTYQLGKCDDLCNQICSVLTRHLEHRALAQFAAEEIGLSRDYIAKQFKRKTGYTLSDYIMIVKLQRAKQLLLSRSRFKVYEVSEAL